MTWLCSFHRPGELGKGNIWLNATQVCHYWRQCSLLWRDTTLDSNDRDDSGHLKTLLLLSHRGTTCVVGTSCPDWDLGFPESSTSFQFFEGPESALSSYHSE